MLFTLLQVYVILGCGYRLTVDINTSVRQPFWAKKRLFVVAFMCPFVCLSVSRQRNWKIVDNLAWICDAM